jgi:hypothetical protein
LKQVGHGDHTGIFPNERRDLRGNMLIACRSGHLWTVTLFVGGWHGVRGGGGPFSSLELGHGKGG